MAEGAREKSGATFALSDTGIAGPGGGSVQKPVGTAYVALAGGGETVVRHLFFPTDRETFKQLATQMRSISCENALGHGAGLVADHHRRSHLDVVVKHLGGRGRHADAAVRSRIAWQNPDVHPDSFIASGA